MPTDQTPGRPPREPPDVPPLSPLELARWGQGYLGLRRRTRIWAAGYRAYLRGERPFPPYPMMLQVTPTERCNLSCPYCNQWGPVGYHRQSPSAGRDLMPAVELLDLLRRYRRLQPDFMFNLHGGEPFLHPELDQVLEGLERSGQQTFISTNATVMEPHLERLARINRQVCYQVSLDGGEACHDRIRGQGVTRRLRRNLAGLHAACARRGTGRPRIIVNFLLHGGNGAGDVADALDLARRVGAFALTVSLREYVHPEAGDAFEAWYSRRHGRPPSRRWRGSLAEAEGFATTGEALAFTFAAMGRQGLLPRPPLINTYPMGLSPARTRAFHENHLDTFGIRACLMPAYWCRVAADGTVHLCSGFQDIAVGNVLRQDFAAVWRGEAAREVQRRAERGLQPICHRCCGMYLATALVKDVPSRFLAD